MLIDDFYSNFNSSIAQGDVRGAYQKLMKELGFILVREKKDFVDLLNESNIPATIDMTSVNLVDLFVDNIDKNKKLMLGASILVNSHNKKMGFDGDTDDQVKDGYLVMKEYFSNAVDPVTAIAEATGKLGEAAGTIVSGSQKNKYAKNYGGLDLATKKEDTKAALIQSVMAGQQAAIDAAKSKREQKAKTTKTLLIVGGVILGLAIVLGGIYMIKKRGK